MVDLEKLRLQLTAAEEDSLVLQNRLKEAEDTLRAIQNGEVDALVISRDGEEAIYTLESADRPYRILVETMNEGAVTLDAAGTVLYCNQRFAEIAGVPLEAIIGSSIYQFLAPQDRPSFEALLRAGWEKGGRMELALRTAAGVSVPVLVSTRATHDLTVPVVICLVVTDLSEQKRNEELIANERLTRHILEQAAEVFIVCDAEGTIIRASRATHGLLGVSPLFRHFDEAFTLCCDDGTTFSLPHSLADSFPQAVNVAWKHGDGSESYFLLSGNPLLDQQGIIGSIISMVDITQHKLSDLALQERTRQLESANRELESFSYSVSHDLGSPLRAIDGYTRMLPKQYGASFPEDATRKFQEIRNNAQRMGQLIEDLLAFSRIGRKEVSLAKLDMNTLIQDVWQELQVVYPERNMTLTVNDLPSVMGDRPLLKQACSNLLQNAVKYTKPRAAALIEVGGETRGNEVFFHIRDNGVGFDMAYRDKLFAVFQRLHSAEDFEGTGIGLAIVQRIIGKHGGRVWGEGQPDQGACFYFTLPTLEKRTPQPRLRG